MAEKQAANQSSDQARSKVLETRDSSSVRVDNANYATRPPSRSDKRIARKALRAFSKRM
jgi:hypothetical protein